MSLFPVRFHCKNKPIINTLCFLELSCPWLSLKQKSGLYIINLYIVCEKWFKISNETVYDLFSGQLALWPFHSIYIFFQFVWFLLLFTVTVKCH